MFEEMEATSRPEHPTEFRQNLGGIGDGAERERGERGVAAGVVERDRLAIKTDVLDGCPAGCDSLGGQPPCERGGFDCQHLFHFRWIVLDIETRAESDLDDPARQILRHLGAPASQSAGATCPVHQAGKDLLSVEAHGRDAIRAAGGRGPQ